MLNSLFGERRRIFIFGMIFFLIGILALGYFFDLFELPLLPSSNQWLVNLGQVFLYIIITVSGLLVIGIYLMMQSAKTWKWPGNLVVGSLLIILGITIFSVISNIEKSHQLYFEANCVKPYLSIGLIIIGIANLWGSLKKWYKAFKDEYQDKFVMRGKLVRKHDFEYPVNEYCDIPVREKASQHIWEHKHQCIPGEVDECGICGHTFCGNHGQDGRCMLCIYDELNVGN